MSVRILYTIHEHKAVMYDSVTGVAFGPVVDDGDDDAQAILEAFIEWLPKDAREYGTGIMTKWINFVEGK